MLTNPYAKANQDHRIRVVSDIPKEEKALLFGVFPQHNCFQLIINNLLKNLCDDLRKFEHTTYTPDSAAILAILLEPRNLRGDQVERLYNTSVGQTEFRSTNSGIDKSVPPRIQQPGTGDGIPAKTPDASSKRPSNAKQAGGGKQRPGKTGGQGQETNTSGTSGTKS